MIQKNSQVYLKGILKPIEVSMREAESVEKVLESGNKDMTIQVSGATFKASEVKFVKKEKDKVYQEAQKDYFDKEEKYIEYRKSQLKKSVEERAKELGFFRVVCFSMLGRKATDEELAKAETIQRDFFKKNPKRLFCNPILFSSMLLPIGMPSNGSKLSDTKGLGDEMRVDSLGIVKWAINEDIRLSATM